jgi:hypothetical protein
MHSFASWVTHSWKRQETCMYCLFCLCALLLIPWFALQCLHSLPTRSICTRGVKSVLVALSAVFLHVIHSRDVSVRVSSLASSVAGKVSSVRCWFLDPVVKSSYRLSSIKALRRAGYRDVLYLCHRDLYCKLPLAYSTVSCIAIYPII